MTAVSESLDDSVQRASFDVALMWNGRVGLIFLYEFAPVAALPREIQHISELELFVWIGNGCWSQIADMETSPALEKFVS